MSSYRTEIIVPPDRYVYLRLPPDFPEGRATVVVEFSAAPQPEPGPPSTPGPAMSEAEEARDEFEWWEASDDPHAGWH